MNTIFKKKTEERIRTIYEYISLQHKYKHNEALYIDSSRNRTDFYIQTQSVIKFNI